MLRDEHGLCSGDSRLYQSDNQINRGRVLHEDSALLINCHLFGGDDKIKQKLSGCSSLWTPKEIAFPSFHCKEHVCPTFILGMHRLRPTGPSLILKTKEMILSNREEYRTQEHRPRVHEFISNWTQARVIWKKRISNEKMPPSNWLLVISVGYFLG